MAVHLSESRTVALPPVDSFARTMPMPLNELFTSRGGQIPPVTETREQPATWESVGQTHRIMLGDGGTMRETLTCVDSPRSFGYVLDELTGPIKLLVSSASGLWSFEPDGSGCRITWSWTLHPRGRVGALAMPVFGRFWHRYARNALAQLDTNLART